MFTLPRALDPRKMFFLRFRGNIELWYRFWIFVLFPAEDGFCHWVFLGSRALFLEMSVGQIEVD